MYSLVIKNVSKATDITNNQMFLEITVDILKDNKVVDNKKFGYSLGSPRETIMDELEKYLRTYATEQNNLENEQQLLAANENAEELIDKLTGEEITHKLELKEKVEVKENA